MLLLELADHPAQRLIHEIQLALESRRGSAKHILIAGPFQLLANTYRLEIRAKNGGNTGLFGAIVVEAVNLVEDRLNVERIVAFDIAEVGGPAVVWRGSGSVHWRTTRKLGQSHRNGVDFGPEEVIDAVAARAVGPFVGWMFVCPCCAAAVGLYDFKNGIHAQVLVRENGAAAVVGIARQKVRVDAASAVHQGQVCINRLVQFNDGAPAAGTRPGRSAQNGIGGCRAATVCG